MATPLSSETLHASCVAIEGRAVLIVGPSGMGKSDLALRLIDRGATLVSDDYTIVRRAHGSLLATAPVNIAGLIEVRGIGLLPMPSEKDVPIALVVSIDGVVDRLPEPDQSRLLVGVAVPFVSISPHEASAPLKVELALKLGARP
jgi:serine kinase of HPr protein (carbohydrate metabolism regulator)